MDSEWIRWVGTFLLGWIAYEMRGLRRDVQEKIPYRECNRRMDEHKGQIDELDERVRKHGWEINRIRGKKEKRRKR